VALSPGDRLGPYEILAIIGEGGMGQVYRGRDTKLGRQVAIKTLPEHLAADPDRTARFDREARTLAALNHPHIAQIYGIEQRGDTHALVMELVDGEDLAERIARGPIGWRDAEPIARQIAAALEAAHEQGIVHRDLKPANIKVTPDGVVKVLDFGLAKAMEPGDGREPVSASPANSPTITSPAGVTQAGIILGTAAYMSPEQAKGRPADKRSDVWAFGCVLYEMLTGRRAFPGDDVMETLSAVIRGEADLSAVPADVPPSLKTLIGQCLIKDRRERISDIAVARYALRIPPDSMPNSALPPTHSRSWWWPAVALAGIVAAAVVAWPRPAATPAPPVIRATIDAPTASTLGFATLAISPQGTHIVYASTQGRLHLRRLNETEARPLPGSDGGVNPFFSPDGEWIAFFAQGELKKVPIAGGAAKTLARAPSARGGSWSSEGTIVYAPEPAAGLFTVSADGGESKRLTSLAAGQRSHRWPHLLPDGKTVLFTIQVEGKLYDDATIAALPLSGGEPRTVIDGGSAAQYSQSGHLIYARAGSLLAVEFDASTATTRGAAITIVDNARTNTLNGAGPFALSANGVLLYLPGQGTGAQMTLMTASRTGQTRPLIEQRLFDNSFRIAPDGRRIAVSINDGQSDVWLVDFESRGISRFTLGSGSKNFPVWSTDGSRIYYASTAGGVARAMVKALDGSPEEPVTPNVFVPMSISPDGAKLIGQAITNDSLSTDVVMVDVARREPGVGLVATGANETQGSFSPDGKFLAYQSDESGRTEVYVQAYPSGSRWQLTTGGGVEPRWTKGGRELVYRDRSSLFAVPITPQPFLAGPAQSLFNVPNLFAYDVTADGNRFVVAAQGKPEENVDFVVISGWFEELKTRMQGRR
jgi:serine/threonine-protein kinase